MWLERCCLQGHETPLLVSLHSRQQAPSHVQGTLKYYLHFQRQPIVIIAVCVVECALDARFARRAERQQRGVWKGPEVEQPQVHGEETRGRHARCAAIVRANCVGDSEHEGAER